MFDIGWAEMAIIMLVALIVIGPKDLPRVARTVGRWVRKGRSLAREVQNQLEDMARETELDKVKTEIERAARTDVRKSVEKTIDPRGELKEAFDPTVKSGASRPGKGANGETAQPEAANGQGAGPEHAGAEPGAPQEKADTDERAPVQH